MIAFFKCMDLLFRTFLHHWLYHACHIISYKTIEGKGYKPLWLNKSLWVRFKYITIHRAINNSSSNNNKNYSNTIRCVKYLGCALCIILRICHCNAHFSNQFSHKNYHTLNWFDIRNTLRCTIPTLQSIHHMKRYIWMCGLTCKLDFNHFYLSHTNENQQSDKMYLIPFH